MRHALLLAMGAAFALVAPGGSRAGTGEDIQYRAEMIRFVGHIAARARASDPSFGIFPQNAAELGADAGYLALVTGIGQEDLYYGYARDGRRTPPAVTRRLETHLDRFTRSGKLVLTVDYPFRGSRPRFDRATRRRINRAYRRAAARGYLPYATVRPLNRLVVNPGHRPSPNRDAVDWGEVEEWAYQLQPARGQGPGEFLNRLGGSGFDLLVMDYSFDGGEDGQWTAGQILQLRQRSRGKLLAYLSIGEAESYRFYWKRAWDRDRDGRPDPGAPGWLEPANPEWEGNYKVRYWQPEWQQIVFDYLDRIRAQGFDGVYLDLVDAYAYFEARERRLR